MSDDGERSPTIFFYSSARSSIMNTPRILSTIAAAGVSATMLLVAAGSAHADSDRLRQSEVRQLREAGKIMSIEDILGRARNAQPGEVVEVELEREDGRLVYEVKLIDDGDRIHKLELDAASGEVLNRKSK